MSLSTALSGLGSNVLGNPKKALLIIPTDTQEPMDDAKIAMRTAGALESASKMGTAFEMQSKKAFQTAGFHICQVQYNPSSISISANAIPMPIQYLQTNEDNGIPNQNHRPPSIVMTVELIFDAVNNKDAFMFEKFRLSAGDLVSAGAGVLKRFKSGYSVLPQTNGLMAVPMRKSTRDVIFQWANMTFSGSVNDISARYTMFSVSGKPIRSVVRMSITQKVEGKANLSYWNKAFDKCFGDEAVSALSGGNSIGQDISNLLNISI